MAAWVSSSTRALLRLEAQSCHGLLADMCTWMVRREQEPEVNLPRLTLHLHSGQSVTGFALRMTAVEDGHWTLLFQVSGQKRQDTGHDAGHDVMYTPLSSIAAVTLHDAPAFAPEPEAPTQLELERRVARLEELLVDHLGLPVSLESAWQDLSESPGIRHRLAHALDDLESVFEEMARDTLALAALRSQLRPVRIGSGAEPGARMPGAQMPGAQMKGGAFRIVLAKGFETLDRASMKRTLEAGI